MRIIGLSPKGVFSGFETSFFSALLARGATLDAVAVEAPWYKLLCTLRSFYPVKRVWGLRRDRLYYLSEPAFLAKSKRAAAAVVARQESNDLLYQVGSLWNPALETSLTIPFVLQVDYTTRLANRRQAEWKVEEPKLLDFWIAMEKRLYADATVVLTTTENARRSIVEDYGVDPKHVVTVGAGVSPPYDRLEDDRFPDYESRKILFVGKGVKGKGLDTLLAAFERVVREIPEARLTVVGPTQAISGKNVDYLGRIADRHAVRELYYRHAVFAMPSLFEPLGQVFLEAMSCKLPCIGTTLDAMPEMILDGTSGYTIRPGDVSCLADRLIDLLRHPERCRTMGAAGYARLKQHFTWEVVGNIIFEQCRSCLAASRKTPS